MCNCSEDGRNQSGFTLRGCYNLPRSRQMDLGSLSFSVCVIMICLPGAGYCSNSGTDDCPCPGIPPLGFTQPADQMCRKIGSAYRYACTDGYVRKAGTSSRTVCNKVGDDAKWSNCSLVCIPDPRLPPKKPPTTTTTTPSTSQHTTHSVSISVSMTAKTDSTEPTTSSGPVQWSLSDQTQGENLNITYESATVTSATSRTMSPTPPLATSTLSTSRLSTSTLSTSTSSTSTSSTSTSSTSTSSLSTVKSNTTFNEARTGQKKTAAVISCVSLLIIICSAIGLFYCKRRSRNNMPVPTEEVIQMNCALSSEPAAQSLMPYSDKTSPELKGSSACCEESITILNSGEST